MLSLSKYSSKVMYRSITPFGVISKILFPTVWANSWSWVVNKTVPGKSFNAQTYFTPSCIETTDPNQGVSYLMSMVLTYTNNDRMSMEEAIKQLEQRLAKNPEDENNYLKLVYRYSEMGDTKKAFDTAKKLLEINPDSQLVHLALYKFYLDDNDTQNAISSMKIVLTSSSINPDAKAKVLNDFVAFVSNNPEY